MKKTQMLPLAAIISGLLVGCGGGGGGGGGGSSSGGGPAKTSYAFSFYSSTKLTQSELDSTNCSVFKTGTDINNNPEYQIYTKATATQVDSSVIGFYSDENGKLEGDYLQPSNNKLVFYSEDIPVGGYFTFQVVDTGGSIIDAVSFSKEFIEKDGSLRNSKFGINQVSQSVNGCETGDNYEVETANNIKYHNNASYPGGASNFNFYSQVDEVLNQSNSSLVGNNDIDKYDDENTVVIQYTDGSNSELSQYALDNWPIDPSFGSIEMSLADQTAGSISYNNSSMNITTVPIELVSGNYSTKLFERVYGDNVFSHPAELVDEKWVFEVEDTSLPINASWGAKYSSTVDSSSVPWSLSVSDALLYSVTNLADQKASVIANAISNVVSVSGAIPLSDELGMQRIAYRTTTVDNSITYRVTHVIYSLLSDQIAVPDLNFYAYPSGVVSALTVNNSASFNQDHLVLEELSSVGSDTFLSTFSSGQALDLESEVTGLVVTEKSAALNRLRIKEVTSLFLERSDI
ncbi:hypothetical protein L1D16_19075 [Vibrio sp. Isolate31]|uniref:hypothetical protein n=1 Tax=Vibrio sp. Isolate31 TaxID=2908537 RepID=UPI001EFCF49F|nr:hypothetical protein [Vibrio sp. Isolate31]MCG9602865.1 hypothetical protein [Vibrio sp. Isolate31]